MLLMPIAFPVVVCRRHVQSEDAIQQKTFKSLQREGDGIVRLEMRRKENRRGEASRKGQSTAAALYLRALGTGRA